MNFTVGNVESSIQFNSSLCFKKVKIILDALYLVMTDSKALCFVIGVLFYSEDMIGVDVVMRAYLAIPLCV